MESYWDLYVAYVNKCVADNWANDVDPAHYEMEWNHFLPKCVFGDQPIGHWLTKRQHAIASALQTLAFKQNCMFGWHKFHLPDKLLELAWPFFREHCRHGGMKGGPVSAKKSHEEKNEEGKSKRAVKAAKIMNETIHQRKDKTGKSLHAIKLGKITHSEKDEKGRSVLTVKINSQRWQCLVTGHISNPAGLSSFQRKRGIDYSQRVRREDLEGN